MSPKDQYQPRLVIIEGKDKGKVISLEKGNTVIGRTKGDVILQDARISRSHVVLNTDPKTGKVSFTDLKSLNGTFLNGTQMEQSPLTDGDRLQIGNTLFDCQLSPAAENTEAPPAKPSPILQRLGELTGSFAKKEPEFESPQMRELDEGAEPAETPEPQAEAAPPSGKNKPRRKRTLLNKMNPRQRALALAVLFLGGIYFLRSGGGPKPPEDFGREVTSVLKLEKEGRFAEALQKAEALSQAYGGDPELFITLGGLYALQNRLEPAIGAYRKAKALQADHPIATVRLIGLYLKSGMGKEAESEMMVLDRMMKDGQHSRELFIEAANLFLEYKELTRSPEKALILSRALQNELATDSTIGFKLEAQLMFQQGQNAEALEILTKGLERDPQDEWLLENLAFAKLSLKDVPGAMQTVETWIRFHPMATKALLVMAYLKYNDKNFLGAIPHLQKILEIGKKQPGDPHIAEAFYLIGQIYWQQGQTTEAKTVFSQACQLGFTQACNHSSLRTPQATPPQPSQLAPGKSAEVETPTSVAPPEPAPAAPAEPSAQ